MSKSINDDIIKTVPEVTNYLSNVIQGKITRDNYASKDDLHKYLQDLLKIIVSLHEANLTITNDSFTKGVIQDNDSNLLIEDTNEISKSEEVKKLLNNLRTHISTLHSELLGSINKEHVVKLKSVIDNYIELHKDEVKEFDIKTVKLYFHNLFTGFGILTKYLLDNDDIEEIQIIDYDDIRIMGGHGKIQRIPEAFSSPRELASFVDLLTNKAVMEQPDAPQINQAMPFVRLRIGTMRISIMGGNIAKRPANHPCGVGQKDCYNIIIRKQKDSPMTTDFLLKVGSTTEYGLKLIQMFMKYGTSIIGFGGTGTGKTSMLTTIMKTAIPDDLNVITIAETDEMSFRKIDLNPYLLNEDGTVKKDESGNSIKNPNYGKGLNRVLMWELANPKIEIMDKPAFVGAVNASLTATPDIIILQETKGGEVKDLMEEAFTGHQVITTMHVNETQYVPLRILLMYQQSGTNISENLILKQVPASFPIAIEFTRFRDGSRKISEISEVVDIDLATQSTRVKPFVKFRVTENKQILDEKTNTYKFKTEGEFDVIYNPMKSRVKNILLKHGITKDEIDEINKLYEINVIKDPKLKEQYQTEYGYTM